MMVKLLNENKGKQVGNEKRGKVRWAGRDVKSVVVFMAVMLGVLGGDLWLKHWSFENVADQEVVITQAMTRDTSLFHLVYPHEPIVLLPKVLSLHLTINVGAVFGLGQGGWWFFVPASVLAVGVLGWLFYRSEPRRWFYHVGLALVMAGAWGNLYDRMRYGCVRDMLWLFPQWEVWPWLFNVADAALMVGVGILMVMTFVQERAQARTGKE